MKDGMVEFLIRAGMAIKEKYNVDSDNVRMWVHFDGGRHELVVPVIDDGPLHLEDTLAGWGDAEVFTSQAECIPLEKFVSPNGYSMRIGYGPRSKSLIIAYPIMQKKEG